MRAEQHWARRGASIDVAAVPIDVFIRCNLCASVGIELSQ